MNSEQDNKKRPRVYVPNKGAGHDYSPASKFGDLVFVTLGRVNPLNTGQIFRKWTDALKTSTKIDFIIVTSLNTLCMIGAALFAVKHKRLNLLMYTAEGVYRRRDLLF